MGDDQLSRLESNLRFRGQASSANYRSKFQGDRAATSNATVASAILFTKCVTKPEGFRSLP